MTKPGAILLAVLSLLVPARANGVVLSGSQIDLLEHRIVGTVRDRIAEITVEQCVYSRASRDRELIYVLTLPVDATVTGVAMTMNGKWIDGSVLDRDRARKTYEAIVARKRDPMLFERIDEQRYRVRIFPLPPRTPVSFRYTYQQVLPSREGAVELRYLSAKQRFGGRTPKRFAGALTIQSPRDIDRIEAPGFPVEVTRRETRSGTREATLHWNVAGDALDHDLVLRFRDRREKVTFTLIGHRPSGADGTFVAILQPPVDISDESVMPKDVVFVLDTSGSMGGDKIREAKAALVRGIDGLREGDRFNMLGFSTGVDHFRDRLVPVGDATRRDAKAWVSRIRAAGGTALDDALGEALQLGSRDRLGIVALITDGMPTVGISDPTAIVRRVQAANGNGHRVFVFGVGLDQKARFLDRIAQVTRAKREDISTAAAVAPAMRRFFRRIERPVMTDLSLVCDREIRSVRPHPLPDLFAGDEVVVVGRYPVAGACRFTLTGRLRGRIVTHEFVGTLPDSAVAPCLPRFWAQREVDALLAAIAAGGDRRELVPAVRNLANKYAIVTKYTAGLVLEPGTDVMTDSEFEEIENEEMNDSPFVGRFINSAIGTGGGFNLRRRAKATEEVHGALRWMASRQEQSGSFGGVEPTASALLGYLAGGFTDRGSKRDNPYSKTVRGGIRFLMNTQDAQGRFDKRSSVHVRATTAMVEAYLMTRNPRYKKPARQALGVVFAIRAADTQLAAEIVVLLRHAKSGGLEIDPDMFERARKWLARKDAVRDERDAAAKLVAEMLLRGTNKGSRAPAKSVLDAVAAREWVVQLLVEFADKPALARLRAAELARQRRDGSFGTVSETARACRVLLIAQD